MASRWTSPAAKIRCISSASCLSEIRRVLLEHHREDSEHGLVISRRGPLLLERDDLVVAGRAKLHEVSPTDLGKNPGRQLSAGDGTQKLAGDMDVGHFPSLVRRAIYHKEGTTRPLRAQKEGASWHPHGTEDPVRRKLAQGVHPGSEIASAVR
jgi:hypothetical protein